MMSNARTVLSLLCGALVVSFLAACESSKQDHQDPQAATREEETHRVVTTGPESSPLLLCSDDDPYELAMAVKLPETAPLSERGLHNVYHLGDRIISGSEPHGEDAFAAIAELGVKTILTVDGKAPDVEAAKRHGLRYVHVPTRYKGITQSELMKIAKTFRETEGPFYVHCFHGRHRGPAAAAVGRVVLDHVDRKVALAEMRQWCGTASKYAGLYRDIATLEIPSEDATRTLDWTPDSRVPLDGYRGAMSAIVRASDNLKLLAKRDWKLDPEHPDLDAVNEAEKLADLFNRSLELADVKSSAPELQKMNRATAEETTRLLGFLRSLRKGEASAAGKAKDSMKKIKGHCARCHKSYRNH